MTAEQEVSQLKNEFYSEALLFARHRSPIEDQMVISRINNILDEYNEIELELVGEDGRG